jgi:uncharacterized metal-binding protein
LNTPRTGLVVCNSGASNTGHLTGLAAFEVVKRLGSEKVGICSLPALANKVPTQIALVKKIEHLIVVDGCRNECSKRILNVLEIRYDKYLNLDYDLGIRKMGPFSTMNYSQEDVERVSSAMERKILET